MQPEVDDLPLAGNELIIFKVICPRLRCPLRDVLVDTGDSNSLAGHE